MKNRNLLVVSIAILGALVGIVVAELIIKKQQEWYKPPQWEQQHTPVPRPEREIRVVWDGARGHD